MNKIYIAILFASLMSTLPCAQAADSDDILDFIPAIIAATNRVCDPTDITKLKPGCTLSVSVDYNLASGTLTLPRGVTLEFDGGSIINGTLNLNGGAIDGRLLNSSLTIAGQGRLIDPTFEFQPSKWGIVQVANSANAQATAQNIALRNHQRIQAALDLVMRLGAKTFQIGAMNAFFDAPGIGPIMELPSNLHLKMAKNTILRVQPRNTSNSAYMLRIRGESNVTVSGGEIIGDRLEHGPTDGGNVTFEIKGGRNILIDGMTIRLSSSTGLTINSELFRGMPGFIQSKDVLVRNCIFDSNRNNNLSITAGDDIIIENNRLLNAGIDLPAKFGISRGGAPRIGIVIEPVQGQEVDGVIIRGNTVLNPLGKTGNAILAANAQNIEISGNTTDAGTGWTTSESVQVINNTIIGGQVVGGFTGFRGKKPGDYVVSGNKISDCATGMRLTNDGIKVFNNTITNCTLGIMMNSLIDSEIYQNTITGTVANSFGFGGQLFVDNVTIRNNTININGRATTIGGINGGSGQENYKLIITDNDFAGRKTARITSSKGIDMTNNRFTISGIGFGNSSNILFEQNAINYSNGVGFLINRNNSSRNIRVLNNTITSQNATRLVGNGIKVNTVGGGNLLTEDSNIIIDNNLVTVRGDNFGMSITDFDKMTVTRNTVSNAAPPSPTFTPLLLLFRGNNSIIRDNITGGNVEISGVGNTVSNN